MYFLQVAGGSRWRKKPDVSKTSYPILEKIMGRTLKFSSKVLILLILIISSVFRLIGAQDESMFIIEDIHPHAPHHYLVIPKEHICNPKLLTKKHVALGVLVCMPLGAHFRKYGITVLVREMIATGMDYLRTVLDSKTLMEEQVRLGFHWPPATSVDHLHMHVLYPLRDMSFFGKQILFRPGFLFVTPEWLLKRIQKLPDSETESR